MPQYSHTINTIALKIPSTDISLLPICFSSENFATLNLEMPHIPPVFNVPKPVFNVPKKIAIIRALSFYQTMSMLHSV